MATTTLLLSTMPPLSISKAGGAIKMKSPLFLSSFRNRRRPHLKLQAMQETKEETKAPASPEQLTKKYGLEYGLWKIFSSKEEKSKDEQGEKEDKSKTEQAKELLTKYGGAYLATSLFLSIISFSLCYFLISAGIDVQTFLNKVGIVTDETGGKVGTFALAYAAHKAASPIRFPPTVALTPIVANWIGKKTEDSQG